MVKRIFVHSVVLSVLSWSVAAGAQSVESSESWARFNSAFQKGDFSAIETQYASLLASAKRSPRGVFLAETYAIFWPLASCDKSETAGDDPPKRPYLELRVECWNAMEAKMNDWSRAYPVSTLPTVGLSEINLARAQSPELRWSEGAKAQDEYAERARKTLEEVPFERRTVTLYATLIRIATLQGWGAKRFGVLLAEAASKFPNHSRIYRLATVHHLPKNGGSAAEIEHLAQFAVDKSRDQDGQSMYAHVYDEVMFGQGWLWDSAQMKTYLSWTKMRAGLSDIYRRFPDKWNLNRFAQHACLADDLVTLTALLAQIGSEAQPVADDGWMAGELLRCRKKLATPQSGDPTLTASAQ
ncbi:MAG: hypothetical protein V4627_05970 [Pseudomonadota bacterium]